jgi:hypothetical protein
MMNATELKHYNICAIFNRNIRSKILDYVFVSYMIKRKTAWMSFNSKRSFRKKFDCMNNEIRNIFSKF